jgi:hypothetical protein
MNGVTHPRITRNDELLPTTTVRRAGEKAYLVAPVHPTAYRCFSGLRRHPPPLSPAGSGGGARQCACKRRSLLAWEHRRSFVALAQSTGFCLGSSRSRGDGDNTSWSTSPRTFHAPSSLSSGRTVWTRPHRSTVLCGENGYTFLRLCVQHTPPLITSHDDRRPSFLLASSHPTFIYKRRLGCFLLWSSISSRQRNGGHSRRAARPTGKPRHHHHHRAGAHPPAAATTSPV